MRTRRSTGILTAAAAAAAALAALPAVHVRAQQVSAPAILQLFEASWQTMERRTPDIFLAGYGAVWTPPPGRADQGNFSVGYDVYDRFDLGSAGNPTLYGTETGLKTAIHELHKINANVYTDLIWNHNGFSDSSTIDTRGTATTADDVSFVDGGGYPGFVVTLPNDVDGDFHGAFEGGDHNSRLAGLIDIAQEKNHQFIRQPVGPNPQNIPAGTQGIFGRPPANVPDPSNARFYPDQQGPSTTVYDPALGTNVTYYRWDSANPSSGDAVAENATGYLMRHTRWMVEEIGVDGFRLDAVKHMPAWVLNYYDQAVFRAITTPLLDGSTKHVFGFGEMLDANTAAVQPYIRKDISGDSTVGGNRDALDFALHYALKNNLSDNGLSNNWHRIRYTTQDAQDGFANDGSQGVAFDRSHDDGGAYLSNVANAYLLMRPGNAVVYFNAKEFGDGRNFPADGNGDALGGYYGDTLTTLVNLRNTHGRGEFRELYIDQAFDPIPEHEKFSNVYIFERENSAVVGLNSALGTATNYDARTAFTRFAEGTRLVELTGNAEDPTIDPNGEIASVLVVGPGGQVDLRIPRNETTGAVRHGKGYVVYGPATPQGTIAVTNVARTVAGETPTAATNGTARLASIDIIKASSFELQLDTQPVILNDGVTPGGFHDVHADGDAALFRVDAGLNLNGNGGVDVTTPGDVSYGFEHFITKSSPLFGGGDGQFRQVIDTSLLAEGYHYITARAYRHRNPGTGGDGGPAVYSDFRKVIYVDRLRPGSAVVELKPFGPDDVDVIVQSTDKTASGVHVFHNLGANQFTDEQLVAMAASGSNPAGVYDRDLFKYGLFDLKDGNHAFTLVTFEISYDPALGYAGGGVNVQRFAGFGFSNGAGVGLADLNFNNTYDLGDISLLQTALQSNNTSYNPAADLNADGLVDEADNVLNVPWLTYKSASAGTINNATQLRLTRALALEGTLHVPAGTLDVSGVAVPATPLTFTNSFSIPAGRTITKTGGQALNISAPQFHGAGAVLSVAEGTVNVNTNGGANLTVSATGPGAAVNFTISQNLKSLEVGSGATVTLTATGGAGGAGGGKSIGLTALQMTGGKLDLADNYLVINWTGENPTDTVVNQIATGRNGGTWDGVSGIITSTAAAAAAAASEGVTGLAWAPADALLDLTGSQTTLWAGQTVDATTLLVRYTYQGDANLDGFLSGDDYTAIDFAIATPGAGGHHNGDFNYDGLISGDDYTILDFNIAAQGAPIGSPAAVAAPLLASVAAVPEPTAGGGIAWIAGGAMLLRRWRQQQQRQRRRSEPPHQHVRTSPAPVTPALTR